MTELLLIDGVDLQTLLDWVKGERTRTILERAKLSSILAVNLAIKSDAAVGNQKTIDEATLAVVVYDKQIVQIEGEMGK